VQVDLVSPEEILFSGECTQVLTRTSNGDIAFLNDHAPFIGVLEIGAVRLWQADGSVTAAAVRGGFVEVSGNTVTILSDIAEPADRIDLDEVRAAISEAEVAVGRGEDESAQDDLRWAQTRLRVATGDFG
jgi:F-type H+-transporting ATPase subunit epsilon